MQYSSRNIFEMLELIVGIKTTVNSFLFMKELLQKKIHRPVISMYCCLLLLQWKVEMEK